jgi:hypothetical protein
MSAETAHLRQELSVVLGKQRALQRQEKQLLARIAEQNRRNSNKSHNRKPIVVKPRQRGRKHDSLRSIIKAKKSPHAYMLRGRDVQQTPITKSCNKTNNDWKESRRNARIVLFALRKERGLSEKNGMVKKDTNVMWNTVTELNIKQDILFDGPEGPVVRTGVAPSLFMALDAVGKEIKFHLLTKEDQRNYLQRVGARNRNDWHKYGGNKGVSLGRSIVDGGLGGRGGYSGSIHVSAFAKKNPNLAYRACSLANDILDAAFGHDLWYRRAKAYCERVNLQSGEQRTIPGTVFSNIWFTTKTSEGSVHIDHNVVGPAFVMSSYVPNGNEGSLVMKSPRAKHACCVQLRPGVVVGGGWARHEHCNTNIKAKTVEHRTSWVIYLDKRVFGSNYLFADTLLVPV